MKTIPTLKWRRALRARLLLLSAITPAISDPGCSLSPTAMARCRFYRIAADGMGEARLTDSQGNNQPAWSPDGRRVSPLPPCATATRDLHGQCRWQRSAPAHRPSAADVRPAWSPDGKQIAFVSGRQGRDDIWLMQADGSGQRLLTARTADWAAAG